MSVSPNFCGRCGAAIDGSRRFCSACGAAVQPPVSGRSFTTATAPPAGTVSLAGTVIPFPEPAGQRPAPLPLASLGSRLLAQLVDLLVLVGVFFLARALFERASDAAGTAFSATDWMTLRALGATASVALLYFALSEALTGATLGKLAAGIRVAMPEGAAAGPGAALVRNLLRPVDAVGLYLVGGIVALTNARRQRLGDLVAGTVVIKQPTTAGMRLGGVLPALLVAIGGIAGGSALQDTSETTTLAEAEQRILVPAGAPAAQAGNGPVASAVAPTVPVRTPTPVPPPATPAPGGGTVNVTLARDVTPEFVPVGPTTVFPPTAQGFYAVFNASGVGAGAVLKSVWWVVNVGNAALPNTIIDERTATIADGAGKGVFRLQRPEPWPPGEYKVEVFLNEQLITVLPFRVTP